MVRSKTDFPDPDAPTIAEDLTVEHVEIETIVDRCSAPKRLTRRAHAR